MTDELIDMLDLEQLDGLVIQAFGAGNIPKETAQKLENLLQKGIPVALVSRCFNGIAEPVYAYPGGGVQLQRAGVFFVKELNAQKARLKLLIALNARLKEQSPPASATTSHAWAGAGPDITSDSINVINCYNTGSWDGSV